MDKAPLSFADLQISFKPSSELSSVVDTKALCALLLSFKNRQIVMVALAYALMLLVQKGQPFVRRSRRRAWKAL